MGDTWVRVGAQCEISGEGLVVKKTKGGNYNRLCVAGAVLSSGVHTWEVVIDAGAVANQSIIMFIGVAREELDVEKGNYNKKGEGWYLRPNDGSLFGGEHEAADDHGPRSFSIGDRVGVRLDLGDGSLKFYKNGEAFGTGFPAGTISGSVVRAVELVCSGQSITLVPGAVLA